MKSGLAQLTIVWALALAACGLTSTQVKQIGDATCTLVGVITDSGEVQSVCADVSEIATIVSVVSTLRADAGTRAKAEPCKVIPTTSTCATEAETKAGIAAVLAKRTAWFSK